MHTIILFTSRESKTEYGKRGRRKGEERREKKEGRVWMGKGMRQSRMGARRRKKEG